MICPVCKQRWAGFPEKDFKFIGPHGKIKMFFSRITFNLIKRNGWYPKHEEAGFNRGMAYGNNKIVCCGSPDCLETVDAMIMRNSFEPDPSLRTTYNDLVRETKKELAEGKIK